MMTRLECQVANICEKITETTTKATLEDTKAKTFLISFSLLVLNSWRVKDTRWEWFLIVCTARIVT